MIQECIDLKISDYTVMTSQERNKFRARRSKRMPSLKHSSFKKVSLSHAQLVHFSTFAKEKHMLLIFNFSALTFITNARTTMGAVQGVTRGYKDGLQPESLADGNWLVKQNQPVSKIETKSDTNLRSLYDES